MLTGSPSERIPFIFYSKKLKHFINRCFGFILGFSGLEENSFFARAFLDKFMECD